MSIEFVGNVEARDLMDGVADVVVADGFTGNAVLKTMEGTALGIMGLLETSDCHVVVLSEIRAFLSRIA